MKHIALSIMTAALLLPAALSCEARTAACGREAFADSLLRTVRPGQIDSLLLDAESRYFERTSPQRDDALYAAIVDAAEARGAVAPDSRAAWLRADARRAAAGSIVPELEITMADGSISQLSDFTGDGRPTLLLFYDPDCDDCHELIGRLMAIPAVADGSVAGVAVYLDDDIEAWLADKPRMPRGWAVGRDASQSVGDGEMWVVGGIPSLYLIGADGRIIVKDDPGSRVLRMLSDGNKMAEMFAPAD